MPTNLLRWVSLRYTHPITDDCGAAHEKTNISQSW
jgi:hypothetical protein